MRELAQSLAISVSTVSLALRNDPRVARGTRRRVLSAAARSGYRLNPALTQLMSKVRHSERAQYRETLAWLSPELSPGNFTVEYQEKLWIGARDRAGTLGYNLDAFWMNEPGMTGRRMSAILKARGIRGLLIPPLPRTCGHLSIDWKAFSSVALTYTMARPNLHRVVPDHHVNMQVILRALRHRGYVRPGMLLQRDHDARLGNRCGAAYHFYQIGLPARNRVPMHVCEPDTLASCIPWLKRHRPDAVITLGGLRHLRELDLGDPVYSKNLGIVLLGHAVTDAGYTAMDENPLQIGATAVDQLIASLNRNEMGIPENAQTVLVPGLWVEGETLPIASPTERPTPEPAHKRLSRYSPGASTSRTVKSSKSMVTTSALSE